MTNPRGRPRGRPKGSTNKKAATDAGKAKQQHQHHHLSPSVQAQERLVDFVDLAVVPREAAKKATSRLNGSTPSRDATAPSSNGKKGRGRPRSIFPSTDNKADGGGSGSSSSNSSKKRKVRETDESSEETSATGGSKKSHKKTPKKKHGPSPIRGGTGSYPKRIRNAPDVFKAGPSTKPMSPSKPTATTSAGGKSTSKKKGAAAAAAVPKSKAKSPAAKKKPAKPASPPRPPPPPPPYRFDYKGWPAIGGRELLAAGMFLYVSAPMMKFGRGFEVKMQALEEALSSDKPEENELLSLVHSRLLCTGRELKALKPGELKYPYSWWAERLQKKLADWYRRRAVLRELIFEAERSDDEGDVLSAGAGGSAAGKKGPKKAVVTVTKGLVEAVGGGGGGGGGGPTAASGGVQQAAVVGAAGGGGEAGVGLPKGRSMSVMDVEGAVGAAEGTEAGAVVRSEAEVKPNGSGAGMRGEDDAADFDGRKQRDAGGGVEETKGGEELSSRVVVATKAVGERGVRGETCMPKEEHAEISKRVSATQCKVCNARGTVTDMVKCIYEGCGNKYHLRCLIPVVDEVPKGQWYCPDCREKKRVFGCNGCMQNDRPTEILQCDGPMCGLEYHYGCLDPPLDKVPSTKWWYCPDCVRTDNRVGCRVCKVDVDYDKLLKCDGPGCELEWHTYCLKPPVKTVPKGDFFCPYCKAKQKVDFEKKRQQEIARANEKRRRREARKAKATPYSDDDDQPAYGWRGVAGLRGALLAQYEDLEPDSLRLELHRINILLRNIEEAREASDALAAAAAAAAAPPSPSTTGSAVAEDAAEPEPADSPGVDSTKPDAGSPPVEEDGNGTDEVGDRAGSPVVGETAEMGEAAEAAAAAGGGVHSEKTSSPGARGTAAENKVDGATATAATGAGAGTDAAAESGGGEGAADNQGAGSSGGDNGDAAAESGDGQAAAAGEAGGGVSEETDPVAAFWAALAAAAPAEPAPMDDGSGDGGDGAGADEEEQEEEKEVDGAWGGAGDSPLANGKSYGSLSVPLRAGILSALCEDYMEDDGFRVRIIDEVYPDWLRATPFGHDSCGRLYYRFIHFRKEMRVYRTVEGDSPIPPVDKVATEMTGCGTLEAAAEAAADRKPSRLRGGSELELVADSLEGMERLLAALGKSKSKSKRDDAALHTNLAQEVEEMGTWARESMEKEEKRRLADEAREKRQLALEAQPRRRSGRLIRAEAGWAVASLKEKEDEEEEEEEEEEGKRAQEESADQVSAESSPEHGESDSPPQDGEVGLGGTAGGGDGGGDDHTAPAGPGEGTSAPAMMADGSSPLVPMDTGEEEVEEEEEEEETKEEEEEEEEEGEEEEKEDEEVGPGGAAGNARVEVPAPGTTETAAPALGKHPRTDDPSPTKSGGAEEVAAVSANGAAGGGGGGRCEPNGGTGGGAEGGAGSGDDSASKRRRRDDGGVAIPVGEEQTTAAAVMAAAAAAAAAAGASSASGDASEAPSCVSDGVSRPRGGGGPAESSSASGDASAAAAAAAAAAATGDALPNGSSTTPNGRGRGADGPTGKEPRVVEQQSTASAVSDAGTAGADQQSTTREIAWETPPAAASSGGEVGAGSAPLSPPEDRRSRPEAGAVSSPVKTPPLNGMAFSGALDIMALAASSRPRATTPSSSRSPSQDRSTGAGAGAGDDGSPASRGNGNCGPPQNKTTPAAGLGAALDMMASAVDARAPGALLSNGGDGVEGGQEERSPAGSR